MPTARHDFGIAVLNNLIYIAGGQDQGYALGSGAAHNNLEVYDPSQDSWTELAPMPTARYFLNLYVMNGLLYAVGGNTGTLSSPNYISVVEVYDPVANQWSTINSLPYTPENGFGGATVGYPNGSFFAFGGGHLGSYVSTNLKGSLVCFGFTSTFTPTPTPSPTFTWSPTGSYTITPTPTGTPTSTGTPTATFLACATGSVPTLQWASAAAMPNPRGSLAGAALNGIFYAIGGDNYPATSKVPQAEVDAYDPVANSWSTKASLPLALTYLGAGVVNGTLYEMGGQDSGGFSYNF